MGSHEKLEARPTRDELTEAEYVAWMLKGTTKVKMTEHAVYAFGADAWVCPKCLKPNHMVRRGNLPLAPTTCLRCRTRLL